MNEYKQKRNLKATLEPQGRKRKNTSEKKSLKYVIQKHDATHLHYDLRLELDGVLKSWAIPKTPTIDPDIKRLAIEVKTTLLSTVSFEGRSLKAIMEPAK